MLHVVVMCEHCGEIASCVLSQHEGRYLWHCGRVDTGHPPLKVVG